MQTIADTGYLFALADTKDTHHQSVLEVARVVSDTIILPVTVLPEICYLLDSRLGHDAMRRFLARLQAGPMLIESIVKSDLARVSEILEQYQEARIDFVDATIVALAERLNITRILTIDQRHFRLFRPKHCTAFEILP
jgi:predicted nucleic acid-binding protein